jgi:hypothetical protein
MNVLERVVETEAVEVSTTPPVITGTLVGFAVDDTIPLVTYPGQPGKTALAARTIVDLPCSAIGRGVVLIFERGDGRSPIVIGVIRERVSAVPEPLRMHVEADGQRLLVAAEEQLVLRCGRASITLTKAGKVLINGSYISNRSSGVMRIKGGSIQLN